LPNIPFLLEQIEAHISIRIRFYRDEYRQIDDPGQWSEWAERLTLMKNKNEQRICCPV